MNLYTILALSLLVLTHLFSYKLNLTSIPRSRWLSFAGGISVAYIFLSAFPELFEFHEAVRVEKGFILAESAIFLLALGGLVLFYGLERHAKLTEHSRRDPAGEEQEGSIYWLHLASFALYNLIIGYLLLEREEDSGRFGMILYATAMAFHFMVTDFALAEHYTKRYEKGGRWLLVAAVISGWGISLFLEIPKHYLGMLFAFLAGGVILNVMKEELPKERESNLPAFISGVVGYGVLLIAG